MSGCRNVLVSEHRRIGMLEGAFGVGASWVRSMGVSERWCVGAKRQREGFCFKSVGIIGVSKSSAASEASQAENSRVSFCAKNCPPVGTYRSLHGSFPFLLERWTA